MTFSSVADIDSEESLYWQTRCSRYPEKQIKINYVLLYTHSPMPTKEKSIPAPVSALLISMNSGCKKG